MCSRLVVLALLGLGWCAAAVLAEETAKLLPANTPMAEVIDHYVDAALREAKTKAVPAADDATLIRRLTLDLNGRLPTLAETDEYLTSTEPNKKAKLVDRLMASPAFVRHQAQEFFTFLQSQDEPRRGKKATGLHDYLLVSFGENRSLGPHVSGDDASG